MGAVWRSLVLMAHLWLWRQWGVTMVLAAARFDWRGALRLVSVAGCVMVVPGCRWWNGLEVASWSPPWARSTSMVMFSSPPSLSGGWWDAGLARYDVCVIGVWPRV